MVDPKNSSECEEDSSGNWIITFADLMALLLAFFVLLFSFSKIDQKRYDEMANSFAASFSLESTASRAPPTSKTLIDPFASLTPRTPQLPDPATQEPADSTQEQLKSLALLLKGDLAQPIGNGELQVRREADKIVVQLQGDNSFTSGSAEIDPLLLPILDSIATVIKNTAGDIKVSGHTDDQPIYGGQYSSNWDLSAARAAAVTEYLLTHVGIDPSRFEVSGYADTQPLAANTNAQSRAINRRVEIELRPQP